MLISYLQSLVGITYRGNNHPKQDDRCSGILATRIIYVLKRFIFGKPDPEKTGELHRWLYDRYSLKRLLTEAGFVDAQVRDAHFSRIQDWAKYALDVNPDGTICAPGSLHMEAERG